MRFQTRVAVQESTEVRDASGGISYTWTDVIGMESVPATILPVVDETRQERITPEEELWTVILAGHRKTIDSSMAILHGSDRFEINRVSTTYGRKVTTLVARRVSL